MVATTLNYTDSRYQTPPGYGYDGVVRVKAGGFYASGALLYDGLAVLTTAHLFNRRDFNDVAVGFETLSGQHDLSVRSVLVHPQYNDASTNHDLAIVWLSTSAPSDANRYTLYRNFDEFRQIFNLVGYGKPGTGSNGVDESYSGPFLRLQAFNQFEADAADLNLSWSPQRGTQLVADFDNGLVENDALFQLLGIAGLGLGLDEGMISPGDSGGPAFINGQIAGVASYTGRITTSTADPDIDDRVNSSFGEFGFWQRVSAYQQWIDQSIRGQYSNAPTRADEVELTVIEGGPGEITTTYFLLEFTGIRAHESEWVSVGFATRDGTATAGQDYIPVSGTLILYSGENHAVIPVEIIGDNIPEPDETFYLDVFNPTGGSFGDGIERITAMRTIIDTDGYWM